MVLEEELEKWVMDKTKYITKFYLIKNDAEKRNIELFYKYEKDDEIIEEKDQVGVELKYNLSQEEIFDFLGHSNERFHKIVADHIKENWEQEIFTYNPTQQDTFDMAYYFPFEENVLNGNKVRCKVIITAGKRIGDKILSIDDGVNAEEKSAHIRFIGWSHI